MEDKTYPIQTNPRRHGEDLPDVVFIRPLTFSQLLETCKERDLNMRVSFDPVTNTLEIRFEKYSSQHILKETACVTLNLYNCEAANTDEYIASHIAEAIKRYLGGV